MNNSTSLLNIRGMYTLVFGPLSIVQNLTCFVHIRIVKIKNDTLRKGKIKRELSK